MLTCNPLNAWDDLLITACFIAAWIMGYSTAREDIVFLEKREKDKNERNN